MVGEEGEIVLMKKTKPTEQKNRSYCKSTGIKSMWRVLASLCSITDFTLHPITYHTFSELL